MANLIEMANRKGLEERKAEMSDKKKLVAYVEQLEKKNKESHEETIEAINNYKQLLDDYNALVEDHNRTADNLQGLMSFIIMQCGILRIAITDDICPDPLAPVSILQVKDDVKDLLYLFNGNLVLINAIKEGKTVAEAIEFWQKQI